jgi:16S rRNA (cytosine1402-N4)-methyltransferase
MEHKPVMPLETIECLNIKADGIYIDCTLGGGGHSREIAGLLSPAGRLISIDWDEAALERAGDEFGKFCNVKLACGNFADLAAIAAGSGVESADGVLFDLGFSSTQVDAPERGFSFRKPGPLDMRYNKNNPLTAEKIVNEYPENRLAEILTEYAQEQFAGRIAGAIISGRNAKRITETSELVDVIRYAVPSWYRRRRIHFATKTFQALRMAVNGEMDNVSKGLAAACEILAPGGRLAVISFHSLEHRLVKNIFTACEEQGQLKLVAKKPVFPTRKEMIGNRRSRSAQLRCAEKL